MVIGGLCATDRLLGVFCRLAVRLRLILLDDGSAGLRLALTTEPLVVVALRLEQLHEVRLAVERAAHRREVLQTAMKRNSA